MAKASVLLDGCSVACFAALALVGGTPAPLELVGAPVVAAGLVVE